MSAPKVKPPKMKVQKPPKVKKVKPMGSTQYAAAKKKIVA